ncbi:hypothetical protein LCGC14_2570400, partial [marine sediment metagenome]
MPRKYIAKKLLRQDCKNGLSMTAMVRKHQISMSVVKRLIQEYNLKYTFNFKESFQCKEFKNKISKIVKERNKNIQFKKKMSNATKEVWNRRRAEGTAKKFNILKDDLKKDCESGLLQTEMAKKHSVSKSIINKRLKEFGLKSIKPSENPQWKKHLKSEEHRKFRSEISKKIWSKKENRDTYYAVCNTKEFRQNLSNATKKKFEDKEHQNKMLKIFRSEEYRNKKSIESLKKWQYKEFNEKHARSMANIDKTLTKPHKKVCEILDILNIKYINEQPLGPYRFDIFIKSHNLLIEV